MFDFEKLEVYQKAKDLNSNIHDFLLSFSLEKNNESQLRRAAFSIMLNIAEGSGRLSKRDKRNFYVIARGSTFECVAVFDYLKEIKSVDERLFWIYYRRLEEISKMLFALIRNLSYRSNGNLASILGTLRSLSRATRVSMIITDLLGAN